jgi:hypothetical protein
LPGRNDMVVLVKNRIVSTGLATLHSACTACLSAQEHVHCSCIVGQWGPVLQFTSHSIYRKHMIYITYILKWQVQDSQRLQGRACFAGVDMGHCRLHSGLPHTHRYTLQHGWNTPLAGQRRAGQCLAASHRNAFIILHSLLTS